jgi:hypothetical protein
MSANNGDKARFNNNRKRKANRKAALRLLREALIKPAVPTAK